MKKLFVALIFTLLVLGANAQHTAEVGAQLGMASFVGDIEHPDYAKSVAPEFGLYARWSFNKRMAVRGQFNLGTLKGEGVLSQVLVGQSGTGQKLDDGNPGTADPYVYQADLSSNYRFDRAYQSMEALFEFNFQDYKIRSTKMVFTPYVAMGIGVMYSRAQGGGTVILDPDIEFFVDGTGGYYSGYDFLPDDKEISRLNSEYDTFSPVIPVGMGIKWNISDSFAINVEAMVRKTFTDRIDNLVDPKRFRNLSAASSDRVETFANSTWHNNDWYSTLSVSLSYVIWDGKKACPIFE